MAMEEIDVNIYEEPPRVGLVEAIKMGFKGYVVWNARSTRPEFWWWVLFVVIVAIVALILDSVIFGTETGGFGPIYLIAALVLLLPNISLIVRRLHDTDRTGWWYWIALIPIVGGIVLLVFMLLSSTQGPTRWNNRISL
jgi:uncharacterized membrane protein YhaH (DUF805 family)